MLGEVPDWHDNPITIQRTVHVSETKLARGKDMQLMDLLQLAASRSDSWFDLWQLYFLMTSTVLVVASATPSPVSKRTAALMCGLIALAFIGFWTAFSAAYDARVAIELAIGKVAEEECDPEHRCLAKKIGRELGPSLCKEAWVAAYSLYSLVVLVLTWYIPARRRRAVSQTFGE